MGVCFSSDKKQRGRKDAGALFTAEYEAPPLPESSSTVSLGVDLPADSPVKLTVDPIPPINIRPASEMSPPTGALITEYSWTDSSRDAGPIVTDTHAQVAATQAKAAAAAAAEASAAAAAASLALAAMEASIPPIPS